MKRLILCSAAFVLSASAALAAISTESVIADFQAQGFTRIEVRTGLTQMKVEAIRGTQKVETIYDIATGRILSQETEAVRAWESTEPGISIRERNRDFVRLAEDDNDDDSADDSDDDSGHDGDDDDDDGDDGLDDDCDDDELDDGDDNDGSGSDDDDDDNSGSGGGDDDNSGSDDDDHDNSGSGGGDDDDSDN